MSLYSYVSVLVIKSGVGLDFDSHWFCCISHDSMVKAWYIAAKPVKAMGSQLHNRTTLIGLRLCLKFVLTLRVYNFLTDNVVSE